MKGRILLPLGLVCMLLTACTDYRSHSRGVYMLIDTSGTYTAEVRKAKAIISYILATLQPGDTFAVARIDSGSFSEKDIVAKVTFDSRPSYTNQQKRMFKDATSEFLDGVKGSHHTDITGGLLQAVEYLNEASPGRKTILIFSDMKEDIPEGHVRDITVPFGDVEVKALNVTKLRSDNIDPREYLSRLDTWQKRVEANGGEWEVVNDLDRIEHIL